MSASEVSQKYKIRRGGGEASPVTRPCYAYQQMARRWELLHDLLGGTLVMRSRGERWLPKEVAEEQRTYDIRRYRSVLYNAFKDTVRKLSSKPFSSEVTMIDEDKLPEPLRMISQDVDRMGTPITPFALEVWESASVHGLAHILIDYPKLSEDRTLADEKQVKAYPYFLHVPASDLIGWQHERTETGERKLTQIRIWEEVVKCTDQFGECSLNQIRVYNAPRTAIDPDTGTEVTMLGTWELWQEDPEDKDKEWALVDQGTHSFPGVPLVTVYFEKTGFMTADPPLEDLGWLNLAHWQSMSDQRNILRMVRLATMAATGLSKTELDKDFVIGPNSMLKSSNPQAKFYYVEHNGTGLDSGKQDLHDLEKQMEVMGLQPLIARTANDTATGKLLNEGKNDSTVHKWVRSLQHGLRKAYEMANAVYPGAPELPESFEPDVFDDFSALTLDAGDLNVLTTARKMGDVSRKTYLEELQRRGLLSDSVNIEDELELLETEAAEAQALAMERMQAMGGNDPMTGDPDLDIENSNDE